MASTANIGKVLNGLDIGSKDISTESSITAMAIYDNFGFSRESDGSNRQITHEHSTDWTTSSRDGNLNDLIKPVSNGIMMQASDSTLKLKDF